MATPDSDVTGTYGSFTKALQFPSYFPLLVSVLCQGTDRANSGVDQPDLLVTTGDGFVAAALDPEEWR
ncbi:hypothetical protein GCM10009837_64550 [Streptomyces durmitorensis]